MPHWRLMTNFPDQLVGSAAGDEPCAEPGRGAAGEEPGRGAAGEEPGPEKPGRDAVLGAVAAVAGELAGGPSLHHGPPTLAR